MKNDPLIRSDSWDASSEELDVMKAKPFMEWDRSTRNGERILPPLTLVKAPEEHESRIAMRTSAGMLMTACLMSR